MMVAPSAQVHICCATFGLDFGATPSAMGRSVSHIFGITVPRMLPRLFSGVAPSKIVLIEHAVFLTLWRRKRKKEGRRLEKMRRRRGREENSQEKESDEEEVARGGGGKRKTRSRQTTTDDDG